MLWHTTEEQTRAKTDVSLTEYLIDQLMVEVRDFKVPQTVLCLRHVPGYQVLFEEEVHLQQTETRSKVKVEDIQLVAWTTQIFTETSHWESLTH